MNQSQVPTVNIEEVKQSLKTKESQKLALNTKYNKDIETIKQGKIAETHALSKMREEFKKYADLELVKKFIWKFLISATKINSSKNS